METECSHVHAVGTNKPLERVICFGSWELAQESEKFFFVLTSKEEKKASSNFLNDLFTKPIDIYDQDLSYSLKSPTFQSNRGFQDEAILPDLSEIKYNLQECLK